MDYSLKTLFYLKRDKAGFRKIFRSLSSDSKPSEVTLAKNISSVITHILIEMENTKDEEEFKKKASGFKLYDWLEMQTLLLEGEVDTKDCLTRIQKMLEDI